MRRTWKPNAALHRYRSNDFNAFIRSVLDAYPGFLTQLYGRYAPPGKLDFVGQTETLVEDLLTVLDAMDIEVDEQAVRSTEKVNTSPTQIDRPEWDDDLRAAVRRLEAPVFERFGYE